MELSEVVRRRRMVHVFDQRSVDSALIDRVVDVARRGPSAGFSQGTDFVVLDEPSATTRFWELTADPLVPATPHEQAGRPPVLVLAFSDAARYLSRYTEPDKIAYGLDQQEAWPVKYWETDTAMACMLLLLAAVDEGLGAWFFGVGHGRDELHSHFGVPADRVLIGVIGLGFPGIDPAPRGSAHTRRRRPLDEIVHRNRW